MCGSNLKRQALDSIGALRHCPRFPVERWVSGSFPNTLKLQGLGNHKTYHLACSGKCEKALCTGSLIQAVVTWRLTRWQMTAQNASLWRDLQLRRRVFREWLPFRKFWTPSVMGARVCGLGSAKSEVNSAKTKCPGDGCEKLPYQPLQAVDPHWGNCWCGHSCCCCLLDFSSWAVALLPELVTIHSE